MNFSRGSFRLWIITSTIWVLVVVAAHWESVHSPHLERHAYYFIGDNTSAMDRLIINRNANLEKTQSSSFYRFIDPYNHANIPKPFDIVKFPRNVHLVLQTSNKENAREILGEFKRQFVQPRREEKSTKRSNYFWNAVVWITLPPALILLIGIALMWVCRGFSKT